MVGSEGRHADISVYCVFIHILGLPLFSLPHLFVTNFDVHLTLLLIFLSLHRMINLSIESACHWLMPDLTLLREPESDQGSGVVLFLRVLSAVHLNPGF